MPNSRGSGLPESFPEKGEPVNAIDGTWSVAGLARDSHKTQPSVPDMRLLDSLPFRDVQELGAYRTAPGMARRRLSTLLIEWSLGRFEEKASLVVSELLGNAVVGAERVTWPAGRPPVKVWLRAGPTMIALLVGDAIPIAPVPRVAGDDDESGRGLFLVGELSASWGFYFSTESGGKVVWSVIDTP